MVAQWLHTNNLAQKNLPKNYVENLLKIIFLNSIMSLHKEIREQIAQKIKQKAQTFCGVPLTSSFKNNIIIHNIHDVKETNICVFFTKEHTL